MTPTLDIATSLLIMLCSVTVVLRKYSVMRKYSVLRKYHERKIRRHSKIIHIKVNEIFKNKSMMFERPRLALIFHINCK